MAKGLFSRAYVLLLLVQFFYGTAFCTLFILPKYLIEVRGAHASLVGNVHGVFALASALCVPWVGSWLDKDARRRVLLAGLGLGALSFGPFAWFTQPWSMLTLRALHGISFAMVFSAGSAIVVDLVPVERRAEGIGYFATAMLVTNGFGPSLAEFLVQVGGWRTVFIACSGYCVLAIFTAACLKVPSPAKRLVARAAVRWTWKLAGAFLALFAIGVGVGTSMTFTPALMTVEGALAVTPYFVAYTSGALLQRTVLSRLPDRLGWLRASLLGLGLYSGSLLAVALAPLDYLPVFAFFIGLSHGASFPAATALAAGAVTVHERGRAAAWGTGFYNLGFALTAFGLSPLEPRFGYRGLLQLGALALAACAFGVWRWAGPVPRRGVNAL